MTRMQKIGYIFVGLVVLGVIPIPYLASPDWKVKVVDEKGEPLPGMLVRLSYENYSVENTSHEEDRSTDQNGEAEFPARRSSASTLRRVYFSTLSAMALAHASFGPTATVFAFGNGREGDLVENGYVFSWTGKPEHLESRIVAKLRAQ